MFNFKEFFEKVKKEKRLSKEDLKTLFSELVRKNPHSHSEYSGYFIKNSVEVFMGYVNEIVYGEHKAFYLSKGDLNDVLSDLGLQIENFNSGSYDKELFKVSNLDNIYFNRKLVQFMSEMCDDNKSKKTENKIDIEVMTGHEISLYDLFKAKNVKLEERNKVYKEIYGTLASKKLHKLVNFHDDKLMFSSYTPSDLYESWYINKIYIDEGLVA